MTPSSLTSHRLVLVAIVFASVALLTSAGSDPKKPANKADIPRARVTDPHGLQFTDVTQSAGIRFVHNNGAFGKKYLPETMGPGVAFIDFDNDGWPDIFLVNGMDWPGHVQKHSTPRLYHNNHDGTFTDVTHKAGLDVEMYGMGVAVGDYDNDGFD